MARLSERMMKQERDLIGRQEQMDEEQVIA
jgi:hypothetical protein